MTGEAGKESSLGAAPPQQGKQQQGPAVKRRSGLGCALPRKESAIHRSGQLGNNARLSAAKRAAPIRLRRVGYATHSAAPTVGLHASRNPRPGRSAAPVMSGVHWDILTL